MLDFGNNSHSNSIKHDNEEEQMTILTVADLEKKIEQGAEGTGTCISVDGARIIIPTLCEEAIGFTNPDDLDVTLLERWKNGERGPEFENQKLRKNTCTCYSPNFKAKIR